MLHYIHLRFGLYTYLAARVLARAAFGEVERCFVLEQPSLMTTLSIRTPAEITASVKRALPCQMRFLQGSMHTLGIRSL